MTESVRGPRGKQRWNNAGDVFGRAAADPGLTHSFMGLAVNERPTYCHVGCGSSSIWNRFPDVPHSLKKMYKEPENGGFVPLQVLDLWTSTNSLAVVAFQLVTNHQTEEESEKPIMTLHH